MCIQYWIDPNIQALSSSLGARQDGIFQWKAHVFPRYLAPVLTLDAQGERLLQGMNFGLVPFFEKNEKPKMLFHNARVETIHEKASFKKAFQETRCLVPMNSFFEYIWTSDKDKWVARFFDPKKDYLMAAGIWSRWQAPSGLAMNTFSIVTREPPAFIRDVGHDRCPLFLESSIWDSWLSHEKKTTKELFEVLGHVDAIDWKVEKF